MSMVPAATADFVVLFASPLAGMERLGVTLYEIGEKLFHHVTR